ncbi:MAG TPA: DUF5597 domain-containing protein [Bryobacteraceae bacterium]|nr:DUF5597 domain-containing protein [Bryobacteraceae bacterium]
MKFVGALWVAATLAAQQMPAPHIEKRQLVVDGRPFLVLGGELHNTVSSDLEHMKTVWPELAKAHLNTVLVGIGWNWIEPREGDFDFRIVDAAINSARENQLRIMLLWFGSWKNGLSSFAPAWVKTDQKRFPRVQIRNRQTIEVLSPLSENNWQADARAFAALLRHVKQADTTHRVIMVQVENEVGVLGDTRDRSPEADKAYAGAVPASLGKSTSTWADAFGNGPRSEEAFTAWNYARYINRVAEAGKKEYALPMYVNAWIVQPEDKLPGDYPSGGPQSQNIDIWKAAAPAIDLLAPDIYLPDFPGIVGRYTNEKNPLFVPESFAGQQGAANAFFAIGARGAIGYSPFGIDTAMGNGAQRGPIAEAYDVLSQMAPMILAAQANGKAAAVSLDKSSSSRRLRLGDYQVDVTLARSFRTPDAVPDAIGYGLFIATGPNEYYVAGDGIQLTFTPLSGGVASVAQQEAGRFENGKWIATRQLGGDDSVLRYDIANQAQLGQSGTGVKLPAGKCGIQRVEVYRYQ